jgi:hypothetical protein
MNSTSDMIVVSNNAVNHFYMNMDIDDINKLVNENNELRENLMVLSLKLKNWEKEIKILSLKYRAREEDVDTLINVKDNLMNKNDTYKIKIVNLESENDLLKNVIKKQVEYDETEIIHLNDKIQKLNQKIYRLTSENIRLKKENKKNLSDFENEKNEMIRMHNEDKSDLDYLINILVENDMNQNIIRKNIPNSDCDSDGDSDESNSDGDSDENSSSDDDFGIDFKVKEFNILQNNVTTFYDIILSLVISCVFYNIVVILSYH